MGEGPTATLERYLAKETVAGVLEILRELPADVDVTLAARAALQFLADSHDGFTRSCKVLPIELIRAIVRLDATTVDHLFLKLYVGDAVDPVELAARWKRGVQVLVDTRLTTAWGSKQRRERFRSLAADARILDAIQGAVAHSEKVRLDYLAVLAADGSDASFDALVRHVDPAFVHADVRLDLLERLRRHAAPTPPFTALLAEVDAALDERRSASPALALGPIIGIGTVDPLWFDAGLMSMQLSRHTRRLQCHVVVDSREARWFSVSIASPDLDTPHGFRTTTFDHARRGPDDLGIGHCEAANLPAWLADVAKRMSITWEPPSVRTGLRGAKRERLARWLFGDRAQ